MRQQCVKDLELNHRLESFGIGWRAETRQKWRFHLECREALVITGIIASFSRCLAGAATKVVTVNAVSKIIARVLSNEW